jgi:hypothetical protein
MQRRFLLLLLLAGGASPALGFAVDAAEATETTDTADARPTVTCSYKWAGQLRGAAEDLAVTCGGGCLRVLHLPKHQPASERASVHASLDLSHTITRLPLGRFALRVSLHPALLLLLLLLLPFSSESPDEVFVFVKWAHKLDAPAVNNVPQSSVAITFGGPGDDSQQAATTVRVRASHPAKKLAVDVPLRWPVDAALSSWSLKTLGVTLVLRKSQPQHAWGSLHPAAFKAPPSSGHTW